MDWVKCINKLPKENVNVLTWLIPYDNQLPASFIANKIKNGSWFYSYRVNITHWMYIKDPIGD
jgi:hypothetical protein